MNGWLAEDVTQLRLEVMKFKMTPVMSFSSFSSLVLFFELYKSRPGERTDRFNQSWDFLEENNESKRGRGLEGRSKQVIIIKRHDKFILKWIWI